MAHQMDTIAVLLKLIDVDFFAKLRNLVHQYHRECVMAPDTKDSIPYVN